MKTPPPAETPERAAGTIPDRVLEEPGLKMFLFFSQLMGKHVLSAEGRRIGKLFDLKVKLGPLFPKMTSLVVRRKGPKKRFLEVGWAAIDSLNMNKISLVAGAESGFRPPTVGSDELLLRDELLDKQVVDTSGAKIERVNDIHLLIHHRDLHIVHVDFGVRGIVRRLGLLKPLDAFSHFFFSYRLPDKLISWKFVQPLGSGAPKDALKLNVTMSGLRELHPSELADILEELDRDSRARLFQSLDVETAADTLEEMEDARLQVALLESAPQEHAADILEEMAPDEATDLLADLPNDQRRRFIGKMDKPSREAVEELLKFREGTAGSIMTKDYLSLTKETTVGQAIEAFRQTTCPLESIAYIYVHEQDGRLAGVCTLRHLIIMDKSTPLGELMNTRLITVDPQEKVGVVTGIFKKYKFLALPVADENGILRGIITLKDILQEELDE